jgi:hypothetical protein
VSEFIVVDPDPHTFLSAGSGLGNGSGSRRAKIKMTHISEENSSARCSLLRDEDFSCSSNVLYGGLGISNLQSMFCQKIIFFSAVNFFLFLVIKTLDLGPEPH